METRVLVVQVIFLISIWNTNLYNSGTVFNIDL